ncbi:hypothetical protein A6X21_04785 [Planctopirus hydrillae]|uniref:Uncharacterized protein n=1 Tax=Planctopirus hydrillae TaxID=1841610 RepID=A0A1C3ENZ4_9PLAN|nr:hypothetical protein A6X21_04785 [Planctopirus hydrillae]
MIGHIPKEVLDHQPRAAPNKPPAAGDRHPWRELAPIQPQERMNFELPQIPAVPQLVPQIWENALLSSYESVYLRIPMGSVHRLCCCPRQMLNE